MVDHGRHVIARRRPNGITFTDLVKILALVAVPIVLVAKQPDLGSAIVMCVVLVVMLVVAGIPGRYLLLLLALVRYRLRRDRPLPPAEAVPGGAPYRASSTRRER